MPTKQKSKAIQFLESLVGELTLAGYLTAIREGEEMSQAAFAARLGVSRSHLCDIEKGRKTLSAERAARFATILGYSDRQFVRLALQDTLREAGLKMTVTVEAA